MALVCGSSQHGHTQQPQIIAIILQGQIVDPAQNPLRQAPVRFQSPTLKLLRDVRTDNEGMYKVDDVSATPGRTYTDVDVTVRVGGFKPERVVVRVPSGFKGGGVIKLPRIRLTGADATAKPPAGLIRPPKKAPPPKTDPPPDTWGSPTWDVRITPPVPELFWNVWPEPEPAPKQPLAYRPADFVVPGAAFMVGTDLAALDYSTLAIGIMASSGGTMFSQRVAEWLQSGAPSVELEAVLVTDSSYVETPLLHESKLTVSLDRIRAFKTDVGRPMSLADLHAASSPFVFGRLAEPFRLTAGARKGWAPMSLTIWARRKPIEEIPFAVCIASTFAERQKVCPGPPPKRTLLGGFDSLRAAQGTSSAPDIALQVLRLGADAKVHVVMAIAGEATPKAWALDRDAETFRSLLADALFESFASAATPDAWLQSGRELHNMLFQASDHGEAFDRAIAAARKAVAPRKPSVFIRMLTTGVAPFVFPIGGLTVGDTNLGFAARLEMPLARQTYSTQQTCDAQWVVLAPPLGYNDDALREARRIADATLRQWESATSDRFDSVNTFASKWLMQSTAPPSPTMLYILAHQEKNALRFVQGDRTTSAGVKRPLREPSVVILNACGGARASSHDFVDAFNRLGATSIVTTTSEVEATLAGDFTNCWDESLQALPQTGGSIGDVFTSTMSCLEKMTDDAGASKHGPSILKYVLLGDASTRVCAPR